MSHFVVIGAGQAGSALVAKLRSEGFEGEITMFGAEPVPPYQRPPLSKAYLLGEMEEERLYLRPESFYADHNITLRLDTRVVDVNSDTKTLTLAGEKEFVQYDALAFCTGAHPRTLPEEMGGMLENVFTIRDLRDIENLKPVFTAGKNLVVVGGGYIGLEAAAVAAKTGLNVTLVEAAPRILQRVACEETSTYFRDLHRANGVDIREGVKLSGISGLDEAEAVVLEDGTELPADLVIVGVGVNPATVLADAARVNVQNGIVTDAYGRTSDPAIWAAGDCATCLYQGAVHRFESVGNAIDQAEVVAQNMLGKGVVYEPKPWFWSDQYDTKLQIAGWNGGYTDVYVKIREPHVRSHWYYKGDQLIAVDAINDPRDYMVGKRLIEAGKSPAPEVICDPETDMKALLKA